MIDATERRLFPRLGLRQQKGSKPRCHLLTAGTKSEVAQRLSGLIAPWGSVSESDTWMPDGFDALTEAQLHRDERIIPDARLRDSLLAWWIAVPGRKTTTTPNWDVVSTCTIGDEQGILLVEAKAHDVELRNEERGKPLEGADEKGVSIASRRNHVRIGACLQDASLALGEQTGLSWALSRDWNYQMGNRFAWAWKLADLGVPVVLVYLGFLACDEMQTGSQFPLTSHAAWEELVKKHSAILFPAQVWDQPWSVSGQALIPIIRSLHIPLEVISS